MKAYDLHYMPDRVCGMSENASSDKEETEFTLVAIIMATRADARLWGIEPWTQLCIALRGVCECERTSCRGDFNCTVRQQRGNGFNGERVCGIVVRSEKGMMELLGSDLRIRRNSHGIIL